MSNMGENVLEPISQLESFDVTKSVLHVRIDNKFEETQDFTAKMEGISEPTLLSLFSSQGLDRLEVEVVIQMQVIEVLPVDEQVQHVVTLAADLESGFNPIKLSQLKEFSSLKRLEEVAFVLSFRSTMVQGVQDPAFK